MHWGPQFGVHSQRGQRKGGGRVHETRRAADLAAFAGAAGTLLVGEDERRVVVEQQRPPEEERERIKRELQEQLRLAESGEVSADQILADEATPKQVEFGELVNELESEIPDEPEDDGSGVPPAPDLS